MLPVHVPEPDPYRALRSAIEYLRDEGKRLGLRRVALALERALALIDKPPK
jgi:hypothetical protein